MDIKIAGITRVILNDALQQAKRGRSFILGKMLEVIDKPADDLSPYAPRVKSMKIPVDKIREVIGTGGKMVNKIIEETGVVIDIKDDGGVFITSPDLESIERAMKMIEDVCHDFEVGEVFENAVVTRIEKFGAFVDLLPGREGLCHISQLAHERVENVEDVVSIGDTLSVKVTEIDERGKVNCSHKALLPAPEFSPKKFDSDKKFSGRDRDFGGGKSFNRNSNSNRGNFNGNRPPRRKV